MRFIETAWGPYGPRMQPSPNQRGLGERWHVSDVGLSRKEILGSRVPCSFCRLPGDPEDGLVARHPDRRHRQWCIEKHKPSTSLHNEREVSKQPRCIRLFYTASTFSPLPISVTSLLYITHPTQT